MKVSPYSRLSLSSSWSIPERKDTSNIDTGSSAMMSSGPVASARAMLTLCLWPPESWKGYLFSVNLGSRLAFSRRSLTLLERLALSGTNRWILIGVAIASKIVCLGLSDSYGILKDILDFLPELFDAPSRERSDICTSEENLSASWSY